MEKIAERKVFCAVRTEYIEVERYVHLHVTDAGEGRPIVLIPGWPLSDEMYEYQYNDLMNKDYRVIGITLRGFGRSDKPYGAYNYDVHARDIKSVMDKLDIKDAPCWGAFLWAVLLPFIMLPPMMQPMYPNWYWLVQQLLSGLNAKISPTTSLKAQLMILFL